MRLVGVRPGWAQVVMRVRPDMVNGHGLCHGGIVFALGDSAFAFACNSHNDSTVAAGASIDFLAGGYRGLDEHFRHRLPVLGDVMIAEGIGGVGIIQENDLPFARFRLLGDI